MRYNHKVKKDSVDAKIGEILMKRCVCENVKRR